MHRVPNAERMDHAGSGPVGTTPSTDPRGSGNVEHLRGLTREVQAGTYRPRVDDVAERVMAWFAPTPGVATH